MQIGHKMTELEAFEVLSIILEHPVYVYMISKYLSINIHGKNICLKW